MFASVGKVTFKLDDWLKVDANFGKAPTLERPLYSPEEVFTISEEIIKFCNANNFRNKLSVHVIYPRHCP